MKKLLLVGSNTVHTYNFIDLICSYFDQILLITDKKRKDFEYETIELDFGLSLNSVIRTTHAIKVAVNEFKPTLIHIHQANSYALYTNLATLHSGIPKILTAWGSDVLVMPKRGWLFKRMLRYNLKKVDFITSDSLFMAEEMKRLCPSIASVLIANFGISIVPLEIKKERIIYSNRLHKALYRVDKIIEAFKRMLDSDSQHNEWKLVVAATGDETESLKQLSARLGLNEKVEFIGWVDQLQNALWYGKATYWVSIPESDATSISLLEAMSSGCIPIVSDLPANMEWIENGVNGVIVNDVEKDFLTNSLSLKMPEAVSINKDRIKRDGTKEANRKKFIELYNKAIGHIGN